MFKTRLIGDKAILARVDRKFKSFSKEYKKIFEEPLTTIIADIKDRVSNGLFSADESNNINTGRLYRSTKSRSSGKSSSDGFRASILFGYFVPYGGNIEFETPRTVSLEDLRKWNENKNMNKTEGRLKTIKRRLASQPRVYPHIQESWERHQDLYYDQVIENLRDFFIFKT